MKNDAASKQFDQEREQCIPVKYFSCRHDRKVYQGRSEQQENTQQPESKTNHVQHFQRGDLTDIIKGLAKMQGQCFSIILCLPTGVINRMLVHYRYAMNR